MVELYLNTSGPVRWTASTLKISKPKSTLTGQFSPDSTEKEKLLQHFGKHRTGVGCVYIQKLQDINIEVLGKLITASVKYLQQKYPS